MTWWAYGYILVCSVLSVAGLIDDNRDGRSRVYLTWGGVAGMSAVILFVAFFEAVVADTLGRSAALLLVTSATFEATSAVKDVCHAHVHGSDDERFVWVGTLISLMIYAPAFGLGAVVALRAANLMS